MLSLQEEQYARKRSGSNNQSKTTIDIDTCTTITPPPKCPWIQNELITLYESEKDIIESGDWLTNTIIDAAQKILAAQFKAQFNVLDLEVHSHLRLNLTNLCKSCTTAISIDSQLAQ